MTNKYSRYPPSPGSIGVQSINGDTTLAQLIAGGTDISVTTSGGTTTVAFTGSSGMAIGEPISGGTAYQILQIDSTGSLLAEGSTLLDSTGAVSVDVWNRALYAPDGATHLLTWGGSLELIDLSDYTSLDWGNRFLYDSTQTLSINYGDRNTFDSALAESLDWQNRALYASDGYTVQMNWDSPVQAPYFPNNIFSSVSGERSLSTEQGEAFSFSGDVAIVWSNWQLLNDSSLGPVLDWNALIAYDNSGAQSVNWGNRNLDDTGGFDSVDWSNRYLYATSGNVTVLWNDCVLADLTGEQSLDWENRVLRNNGGHISVDYQNFLLNDGTPNTAIYWNARELLGTDGTTVLLNWNGTTAVNLPQGILQLDGVNLNNTVTAAGTGTAYTLTTTPALVAFGTTSPATTLNSADNASTVYNMTYTAVVDFSGATFAANQTITLKLRRINNTAADLTNTVVALTTPIVTTATQTFQQVSMAFTYFCTASGSDQLQLWASVSTLPSAGSVKISGATMTATRLHM